MAPQKVIVQGLPINHSNHRHTLHPNNKCTSTDNCANRDKDILKQLFSQFGPVECSYLWSNAVGKNRGYDSRKDVQDNFAQLVFANAEDAHKAWKAAKTQRIRLNDHVLTVTWVQESRGPVAKLGGSCLVNIFEKLDDEEKLRLEKVCKRWRKYGRKSWSTTKSLSLSEGFFGGDERHNRIYLKRCGPHLEELECDLTSSKTAVTIASYCQNIKTLTLDTSDFPESHPLEPLFLFHNEYDEDNMSCEEAVPYLLGALKELKSLTVHGKMEHFPHDLVDVLPASMQEISFQFTCRDKDARGPFRLSKFPNLRSFSIIGHTVGKNALKGIKSLEHLTCLDFSGCSRGIHISNIEKIQNFTKLKMLKIPYCKIDDILLSKIISNNRDLESLDISFIAGITDNSVQAVSLLPNLEVLNVSHLRSITLTPVSGLLSLRELDCSFCKQVTNAGLTKVLDLAPNLRDLDVSFCSITADFFELANTALTKRENNVSLYIRTSFDYDDFGFEEQSTLLTVDASWRRDYPSRKDFYEVPDDDDDYYDQFGSNTYGASDSDNSCGSERDNSDSDY